NAEFKTWNRQLLLGVVPLAGKLPGAWARDEPGQIAIVKYLRQDLSELSAVIRRAKHHHPLDPRIDFPARLLGCRLAQIAAHDEVAQAVADETDLLDAVEAFDHAGQRLG